MYCITKAFKFYMGHNLSRTYSSLAKARSNGAGIGLLNKVGHNNGFCSSLPFGSMVSIRVDIEHFDDLQM